MTKLQGIRNLIRCASLFASYKLCGTNSFAEWWNIVKFAHQHGYLYVGFNEEGAVDMACIAFRVKRATDKTGDVFPAKEEGRTLYVHALVNISGIHMKVHRLRSWYLRNNPQVNKIALHHRGGELRTFKVTKEMHHVKEKPTDKI